MHKQKSAALPANAATLSKSSTAGTAHAEPHSALNRIRSQISDDATECGGRNDKHYVVPSHLHFGHGTLR